MLNSCNSQEFFLSLPQNSMIMLEKEYKYYKDHQNELVSRYPDKYLIIKDQKVISVFETLSEAIDFANANGLIEGEYLLQLCAQKRRGLACVFRSRAYFKDVN
jgi:hypothetical protein